MVADNTDLGSVPKAGGELSVAVAGEGRAVLPSGPVGTGPGPAALLIIGIALAFLATGAMAAVWVVASRRKAARAAARAQVDPAGPTRP
jgi:hypothetical protein